MTENTVRGKVISLGEAHSELKGDVITLPRIDATLTKEGYCADAKAIGDEIQNLNDRFEDLSPNFAENVNFDNSGGVLSAMDVQSAIDEITWMYARASELARCLKLNDNGRVSKASDYPLALENTSGNYVFTEFYGKSGLNGRLGVRAQNTPAFMTTDGDVYNLHHAGNKPTGTYAGTGSTSTVEIDTGGVGDVIMVNSGNGFAFVTPRGAICISGSNVTGLVSSSAKFTGGVLTLNTADVTLNKNPGNYYWQVL